MHAVELVPDMRLVIILTGALTIIALLASVAQAYRQASSKLVFQIGEMNREMLSLDALIKESELRIQTIPQEIAHEEREAEKATKRIGELEQELGAFGQSVRFSALPFDHMPREGEELHAFMVANSVLAQSAAGTDIGEFLRRGHRCLCYGASQNVATARMAAKYPPSAGFVITYQGKV